MKIRVCLVSILLVGSLSSAIAQPNDAEATLRFDEWLAALRQEALDAGISAATVNSALSDVRPAERVIERDRNQPESQLDFWTYLNRIATPARIERGREMLARHAELLRDVNAEYGIPASTMVAVWAVESSFGGIQGGFPVIQSLVTLAYDERRAAMFRRELLLALQILDEGHIALADMQGSWAGAMGQVQFMPSTFVDYGRDADGDGRIDIWQSPADALHSAAAYMSSGWRRGYTWGRQVTLPADFDAELAGLNTSRSLSEWQSLGVRSIDGTALPDVQIDASVVLPDGGNSPAFLVYQNYRALMRWNRSHLFAISVAHLADRIAGRPAFVR